MKDGYYYTEGQIGEYNTLRRYEEVYFYKELSQSVLDLLLKNKYSQGLTQKIQRSSTTLTSYMPSDVVNLTTEYLYS